MNTFKQLSDTGLLWWINRVALHPRGLALALHYETVETDTEPLGWSIYVAPDGIWTFPEETEQINLEKFNNFLSSLEVDGKMDLNKEAPTGDNVTGEE
jgi:hypothetical protein